MGAGTVQDTHGFNHAIAYFSYVSFDWDLTLCTISLSDEKHHHLLKKVSSLLSQASTHDNQTTAMSIHGSLQHVTFVYHLGHHHLPTLSFLLKFPNQHVLHHIPKVWLQLLSWWQQTLSFPNPSCSLVRLPDLNLNIWVDASMSWGISLIIGPCWAGWKLLSGWRVQGQDICWAKAVAIKLMVMWLAQCGFHHACIKIHCDNT